MSSFESLHAITSRLKEITSKLKIEKLSQDELEEFEFLARALFERALIINYKAKEELVFGKKEAMQAVVDERAEKLQEKPSATNFINSDKDSGEIQFDFSEGFKSDGDQKDAKDGAEVINNKKIAQETITSQAHQSISNEDAKTFFNSFNSLFQEALKEKLNMGKITSLPNAIGINDRLLYVKELFSENTPLFNQTINELDTLNGTENALHELSKLAVNQSWNKDNEVVAEFVHLVMRRYVD